MESIFSLKNIETRLQSVRQKLVLYDFTCKVQPHPTLSFLERALNPLLQKGEGLGMRLNSQSASNFIKSPKIFV
jgi:hypothetical protein